MASWLLIEIVDDSGGSCDRYSAYQECKFVHLGFSRRCQLPNLSTWQENHLDQAQINFTCVPTVASLNKSAICSLYKPMQPLEDLLPILRVSLVPWMR